MQIRHTVVEYDLEETAGHARHLTGNPEKKQLKQDTWQCYLDRTR